MAAKRRADDGDDSSSDSDEEADNWVQCDLCNKWRRILASAAATLDNNASWHCDLNPSAGFNSCSLPQELTNAEIDQIQIEQDEEEQKFESERKKRKEMPAVWQLVRDNVFGHRRRKVQDEDDIMICTCKPTWRGGDGCGPDCINRMLCMECVPGYCPCEDKCTNQAFTHKRHAKLDVRRAGAKGFGLYAAQAISAGDFVIEYIGEVLEDDEYLRRKEFYQGIGQRHYYFMTVGNGEVIDACRRGNISRFINHSCEPNCETQKWIIRGELAIGLFATRDLAHGEELTFDYNFERYGDKPMRCYCGSTTCRRFVGGSQEGYDDSAAAAVAEEDASNDMQPIMVTDQEMDAGVRAILDWRVGVALDKSKTDSVVSRIDKLCKTRGVAWTPPPRTEAAEEEEATGRPTGRG